MIIFFRKFPNNMFSVPVLLYSLESIIPDIQFRYFSGIDELAESVLSNNQTFFICYSFMTTEAEKVYYEVNEIRKKLIHKKYFILGGGSHLNGDSTNYFGFDYIFTGYCEESFPYFLDDLLNNSSEYLNKKYLLEYKTVFSVCQPDLNNSFPITKFINIFPPLEIMRGCRWKCDFCQTGALNKNNIQMRSLESVEKYLLYLRKSNFKRINFISPNAFEYNISDNSSFNSIESLLLLCSKLGFIYIEYGIFPSEVRPESITDDSVLMIKKYCKNKKITIGAQSGNNKMLKLINRTHTTQDILNAAEIIYKNNLIPKIDFILGFPDETNEDRKDLFDLIVVLAGKFKAQIHMHYFIPLSGTSFYYKNPTPIDNDTHKKLIKMTGDGIISDWWKNGIKLSRQTVKFRDFLRNI
ncbi:TIGR04013 family B12-binding domain/radical SAM domain-containing protein [Candidatus Desantisbacteria bacterium]|nr:TIGR04013 family B12-binding domain/radical SAM domain-containing protein [Candidatus Desantisbacteria bacterium]